MAKTTMRKVDRDKVRSVMGVWARVREAGDETLGTGLHPMWRLSARGGAGGGEPLSLVAEAVDQAMSDLKRSDERLHSFVVDLWVECGIDDLSTMAGRWGISTDTVRDWEARAYRLMLPTLRDSRVAAVMDVAA